uniref:Snake toxin/toxin-like domain-containing protein n=1 Tax=Amphilophus citrinellus TaxID=61819 RepID=A0A3Q0QZB7_AMPCI
KMKAFVLAVVLLMICISSEALKCNRCVPYSPGSGCFNTVETCQRADEVCAYVITKYPKYSYFKRCMKTVDAFTLKSLPNFDVFTCSSDRCN